MNQSNQEYLRVLLTWVVTLKMALIHKSTYKSMKSLIPKVMLEFGSQVNILTKDTREKLGWPELVKSDYYLKLADQGLIEPLGLCKNV